ncbi:o-succinylbenzoate--CoA ligase [Actinotalea subterranea]|uniref:o-succinylbenzoate--CoA ligase n=1 Tax=Actinotalea subterranea TaxID=2607497 RepID=UPI001FEA88D5|nr:o-succinylbenzoate--CoA ligase [Actinotalea subterranea]
MDRALTYVPVGLTSADEVAMLVGHLRAALDGSGPAVAPVAAQGPSATTQTTRTGPAGRVEAVGPAEGTTVPAGVALVVRTSGSTGRPRGVLLERSALMASAQATHARLRGPGRWLVALPLAHVAGLQVLVRGIVAGTAPLVLDAGGPFDPHGLADAVRTAPDDLPLYTSLVPTQLHRVVEAAGPGRLPRALDPLTRLDAILVGGAAASGPLLERARDLGLRVVTTYGMTETSGGCVYDGVPLDGVELHLDDAGVISVAGPVLAHGYLGYLGDPAAQSGAFTTRDGVRWFRTSDVGELVDGVLHVRGRADDVLVTGGVKVAPAAVEQVLAAAPGVGQVCVVGVPDEAWGQAVTAVVVAAAHPAAPPSLERLRADVSRTLGNAAAPRHLLLVDALPERGPGKIDRAEVTRRAAATLAPTAPVRTEHDGNTR